MKLGEVALFTPRVSEVAEFYSRLFDAKPVHASAGKAVFVLDGVHLMIHDGAAPVPHEGPLFDEEGYPPESDHVAFHVEDLDATVSELSARGITVEVREFPWGRSAYLLDPDGRRLELQASDEATYGYDEADG